MKKKLNVVIWIIAICAILLASYTFYSKNKDQNPTTQPPQNNIASQSSQSSKQTVPDFRLKDLNGNIVRLSDYRGKIVILNFWAVWCKYCKQEMPDLNDLNKVLNKDKQAIILAVDYQESSDTIKNYLSSNNLDLKVLMDSDGLITQTYGISGFPTTFIINKDGTLYTSIPGATNKENLLGIIKKINK